MQSPNDDWYAHLVEQSRNDNIYSLIHNFLEPDWWPNHELDFVVVRRSQLPDHLKNIPADHISKKLSQDQYCFPAGDYVLLDNYHLTEYLYFAKWAQFIEDAEGRDFIELRYDWTEEAKKCMESPPAYRHLQKDVDKKEQGGLPVDDSDYKLFYQKTEPTSIERRIEIHFNDGIWYAYPKPEYTDEEVAKAISDFFLQFWKSKPKPIDEIEWIWCLVGNVVEEHEWGEEKIVRKGTKQFPPGAKVYCFPTLCGDGYENIKVIGKPRRSRRLITVVMRSALITNWRLKKVYDPEVITLMLTQKGWTNADEDKIKIERLAASLKET